MDKSIFYVIYAALAFASMEPASKLLNAQIHPLALTFLRFLIGSLFLLPVAIFRMCKDKIMIQRKDLWLLAIQGILLVCASMGVLQIAVFRAESVALIAVIYCTNSVFTVIFATWLLKEQLTGRHIMAVFLCLLGIYAGIGEQYQEDQFAIFLAFVSAVSMSIFTVLGKLLSKRIPTKIQIGISFPIGTLILGLIELGASVPLGMTGRLFEAKNILLILYLGVAVTGLGYLTYFRAMELSGAFTASLVFFIKPILAPFMSVLILGNANMSPLLLVSVALIISGSLLILKKEKKKE